MNLEDKLDQVRAEYLRRVTSGNGNLLRAVESYAASHTGKMLRPRMLLAAAATLGEETLNSRRTLLLAVAVEMLHNASLLHDDVIDNDLQRRGQPSVNARFGNTTAVLVGDYLLAQIMNLLDEIDDRDATRRINQTVIAMTEAELLAQELQGIQEVQGVQEVVGKTDGTPQDDSVDCGIALNSVNYMNYMNYLKIIDGKTARLFATAAALGNPLYEEFGLHYGRLFQLRDDLADGEATPFTADLIRQEEASLATIKPTLSVQI